MVFRTGQAGKNAPNAGFTIEEPWFYVNQNYPQINVADQERDPDSILNFYRKAIALRKKLPVVKEGSYREHFPLSGKVYTYSRGMEGQKLLVVCSFTDKTCKMRIPRGFDITTAKLVLQNYPDTNASMLHPYETRVYLWNK